MKRFIGKLVFHGAICLIITVFLVYGGYIRETGTKVPDFSEIPTNFISNSVCFNSKLDHLKSNAELKNTNCIILGSSISLNNVDAELLSQKNRLSTYNLSSWGLKPYQAFQFLKSMEDKISPSYLIVTFNNADFGRDDKEIKYSTIYNYLFNNSLLTRIESFMAHFNIRDFMSDWAMRSNFAKRDNVYQSLRFDSHGSILLNSNNFQYSPGIQPLTYRDTTGYLAFQTGIDSIASFCKKRQIRLLLVHSPWKRDVLSPEKNSQIHSISTRMKNRYRNSFLDLSNLSISDHLYVDGGHLYKKGAAIVTSEISHHIN
ncbi:hypothetical protein [Larkinella terrae]|uniref:DUF1574 domain-containing protein n=1 Tax=Larkinella terrae TaxID=2025311 RepID=A0A7K0EUQ0_9BACT|nr:hypothetical protein [Larkinella terrae]MRS65537.1 hypothetical protein [Larkinella terrae]